jgi:hypothetical protein
VRLNSVIWIAAFVILAQSTMISAQQKSSELNEVEDQLIRSFQESFANWTRTTVTPIEGSEDVAISKWKLNDDEVSVTVIRYSSKEEALTRIRKFAGDMKAERNVPEEADEEYSLNTRGNSVTLRKRHFIISIHVNAKAESDERQLVKQVRKLAVKAIKD